jgi:hypothetical protein
MHTVRPVWNVVEAVSHIVVILLGSAVVWGSGGVEWAVLTTALSLLVLAR